MPFSDTSGKHMKKYWTDHFQDFLKPLIEKGGRLEAHRSEPLRGDILKQIITNLIVSPVVVADLTDLNPNVFWELGVRQSFKHCTITIAEDGTELPFDVSVKGTLFYYNSHLGNEHFRNDFEKAITSCLTNPDSPDSSVLETLSGRGTLLEIIRQGEILRRMDALFEECDWNTDLLLQVEEQVKENKKEPKSRQWVSSRFASVAAELLLTDRYLDENKEFYDIISTCFTSVLALNDMLRNWNLSTESTENWFEKHGELYRKRFEEHKAVLIAVREKLSKKVSCSLL
jgi:hypothetical protein